MRCGYKPCRFECLYGFFGASCWTGGAIAGGPGEQERTKARTYHIDEKVGVLLDDASACEEVERHLALELLGVEPNFV